MKKKTTRTLAVSTVIANMLMITITLSLAAVLVAWAGTTYGAFSSGSQLFFVQRGQALQERFVIESVFFDKTASPARVLLFVRNVGVEEINIVAIYVNGTSRTPTTGGSMCTFTGTPPSVTLTVGAVCEFSLSWNPTWAPGAIFNILVASARGNQAAYTARGP
jgi:FlaG/FlaF family flagellin (archaellin)